MMMNMTVVKKINGLSVECRQNDGVSNRKYLKETLKEVSLKKVISF